MDVLSAAAGAAIVGAPAAVYILVLRNEVGLLLAKAGAAKISIDDLAGQLSSSRAANRGLRAELTDRESQEIAAHLARSAAVTKGNLTRSRNRAALRDATTADLAQAAKAGARA